MCDAADETDSIRTKTTMRENWIIGDLHGTIDEFNQLLDKINYDPTKHRVILVGDIIDRGTDPVGLVKQVRKMELESVLGNHEEKCLRWRKHQDFEKITGKDNPMRPPSPERRKEWEAFTKADLQWMANLPLTINIKDNWWVAHAGMEPITPFDQQEKDKIIRIRYVDEAGKIVKPKTKDQPKGSFLWAEKWNQPMNIVFGHQGHIEPTRYTNANNVCVAIDQGCCFGGSLTAFNVDHNEFVQVKANKAYYKR